MNRDIESDIRNFVAENFPYRETGVPLGDDTSFLDNGLIDSTGVLELVFFLEKTFSIRVADDEILPDNLDSIQRISHYVRAKLAQGAVQTAEQRLDEELTHARRTLS